MADRLRWWVIPAALLVMARVVTLGEPSLEASPAPSTHVVPAAGRAEPTQIREAAASRVWVAADRVDTAAERAFVLELSAAFAGTRARCTLWRRTANGREGEPWLTFASTVRADGTVPISGLAAGRYDVVVRMPQAAGEVEFAVDDAVAPGRTAMVTPAPLR